MNSNIKTFIAVQSYTPPKKKSCGSDIWETRAGGLVQVQCQFGLGLPKL